MKQRADLLKITKSSDHHVLADGILTVRYEGERSLGSRASLSDHTLVRLSLGSFPVHGSALSHVAAVYEHFLDDQVIDAIDWPAFALTWIQSNTSGALCICVATDWPGAGQDALIQVWEEIHRLYEHASAHQELAQMVSRVHAGTRPNTLPRHSLQKIGCDYEGGPQ